ncbi:MAG: CPBP family intramembrane glutamic endopeptidase [Planctomycetota bacterium]|jgi:membrane protease YdiL (CAAX protease family)
MAKAKKADKTEDKYKHSTGQLFNFAQDSYLERTSRPIYAIVFLLPFIIFYEMGTFGINTDILNQSQIRVVAFVWLQNLLESLGFGGKFAWVAPPLAVVVILIALQITSRKQWRFWLRDILPMAIECILLAVPLIVLTLFLSSSAGAESNVSRFDNSTIYTQSQPLTSCSSAAGNSISSQTGQAGRVEPDRPLLANIVTGIGAGIYEELLFRLILICVLMMLFQDVLRFTHKNSILLSVLISAALFSAHHHIDFLSGQPNATDPFNLTRFAFRTIAGIYFAVLFAIRGFGITAGTHAFYNIIAVSITARFFQY